MAECCKGCSVDYFYKLNGQRAVCDRDRSKPCMNKGEVSEDGMSML